MKLKLEAVNNSIYTNFKDYFVFFVILAVFLLLRIPAINTPYHQDEYKWPLYAEGIVYKAGSVPHPPLTEFVYQTSGKIFSLNDFRVTPLVFSILNLALLYIFVRRRFGLKTAIISSLFFTFSFYSVLASVMVDTDGAVLPFFFLLALIAYDFFKQSSGKKKWVYALLTCGALFLGILVKLSFVLAIGAIIIDYFFETQEKLSPKQIAKYFAGMLVFGVVIVGFLFLAQNIFPGFSLAKGLHYWETFMRGFASRNFLQTAIQFFKALLYVSPFLVFVSFLRNPFRGDTRVFSIFIFLGLFFYLILFDFSIGALDRYFEFLILPLCIMSASNIFYFFEESKQKLNYKLICGGVLLLALVSILQFINHVVEPLYPKTAWISRIISLKWNFLFPFMGGSGPIPFYVSFLFVGLLWIFSIVCVVLFILKKNSCKKEMLILMMFCGLVYNMFFVEEYLFGKINGSSKQLVFNAIKFIKEEPKIKKVLVYNDNGGWEVNRLGKYERRIYAVPGFEDTYNPIFKNFRGHVLFVDIPHVGEGNIYSDFMKKCKPVYTRVDRYIKSQVLDCSK